MGPGYLTEIIKLLAANKNPFSGFVALGCIVIHLFANYQPQDEHILRWVMHISAVVIFVGVVIFYMYSLKNLPGSQQELMFSEEAELQIAQHNRRLQAAKSSTRRASTTNRPRKLTPDESRTPRRRARPRTNDNEG